MVVAMIVIMDMIVVVVVVVIVVVVMVMDLTERHHAAIRIMAMVMMMVIKRQAVCDRCAEQGAEFGIADDAVGTARATDMMVQADNPVRRRHDHVQIMGNQQNATIITIADGLDQLVQLPLPGHIDAGHGLIQNQKIRLPQ
jgi:hypothetical protein